MDHLHELRVRLFWVLLYLLFAGGASCLIQAQIMAALMRPLGGQHLVYLTPVGGFNFIFKVSLYVGVALILPVIIYHLYRFLEPLMNARHKRSVISYTLASSVLAIAGIGFAYFVSLPAALHFLTSFDIQNVSALLTADSYLTFVITYLLGFAVLFQIPLVLMIINTITPLPPRKLMGFQRFVILAAFIAAAVISPTPDITNQTILAIPIIIMYQVGVMLVWIQSKSQRSEVLSKSEAKPSPRPTSRRQFATAEPILQPPVPPHAPAAQTVTAIQPHTTAMDIIAPRTRRMPRTAAPLTITQRPRPVHARQVARRTPTSIDGITPYPRNSHKYNLANI